MKFIDILGLALFAMTAVAQNDTATPDDDTDNLHGWCQCVHKITGSIDGADTQAACVLFHDEYRFGQYDSGARRCWTQGSRIPGKQFHHVCDEVSGGRDDSVCS